MTVWLRPIEHAPLFWFREQRSRINPSLQSTRLQSTWVALQLSMWQSQTLWDLNGMRVSPHLFDATTAWFEYISRA